MPLQSGEEREVPLVLLAGGRGTRLAPLTDALPKALVEVGGRPFIEQQLLLFRRAGIRRIVICLGYRGNQIRERLGNRALGLDITYVDDGATAAGTAGALEEARQFLPDIFWVSVGDMYLDLDYSRMVERFNRSAGLVSMAVIPNRDRCQRPNVWMRDGRLIRYDKTHTVQEMQHIDSGLALVRSRVLDLIPPTRPADLSDVLTVLSERGLIEPYEADIPYRDIGTPIALAETRRFFARRGTAGPAAIADVVSSGNTVTFRNAFPV